MREVMIKRAKELLDKGVVNRVIGWKRGEFAYDVTPGVFYSSKDLDDFFVYDDFCGVNLSKYLVKESRKEGKVLVFLKPCDTYSFNQLLKEHRFNRENVYVIGIQCSGKVDIDKIKENGIDAVIGVKANDDIYIVDTLYGEKSVLKSDVMSSRCTTCKSKKHVVSDKVIGDVEVERTNIDRFGMVSKIENMTSEERFDFWQGELSRCIRCNSCRNVCPACTCEKCVFDNANSGYAHTVASDGFEDQLFHVIRAMHVAGRCTDCGECQRVCPQHIPLQLINRKIIKDINDFYGDYQAGEDVLSRGPLTNYMENDCEPSIVYGRGVK